MHLATPLLLFGVLARPSAAPACDFGSIMSCTTPLLGFMFGPDGTQMDQTDGLDYSEQQLTNYCRTGRLTVKCFHDIFERCVPFAPDLREFFGNMATLMKGCDEPGFYNKARTVLQCTMTFNQTGGKTNACYNAALRMINADMLKVRPTPSPWTGQLDRSDLSRRFSSGQILDAMCCGTKFYKTCSGGEISDTCGPDAQEVFDDLNMAVLNSFRCNQDRPTRCPLPADPLPEDYKAPRKSIYGYQLDFSEMIRGTMGTLSLG